MKKPSVFMIMLHRINDEAGIFNFFLSWMEEED